MLSFSTRAKKNWNCMWVGRESSLDIHKEKWRIFDPNATCFRIWAKMSALPQKNKLSEIVCPFVQTIFNVCWDQSI